MPWRRVIGPEPPTEPMMAQWEQEGWSNIQIVGPCPTQDRASGNSGFVYVVYLHRSIIEVGKELPAASGWPVGSPRLGGFGKGKMN